MYPYDEVEKVKSINEQEIFVAMPFGDSYNERFKGLEHRVNYVRTLINPCGFAAILWWKDCAHFPFSLKEKFRQEILKTEQGRDNPVGERIYDYLLDGLKNLCSAGLLVLNTRKIDSDTLEFSYWWTPLGSEVLRNMELITEEEVQRRWAQIPTEYRYPVL